MIVLAGLAVGGGHLLTATRRWVNEMEVPPSELARIKWTQARAAMSAGAQAWQNGNRRFPRQPAPDAVTRRDRGQPPARSVRLNDQPSAGPHKIRAGLSRAVIVARAERPVQAPDLQDLDAERLQPGEQPFRAD